MFDISADWPKNTKFTNLLLTDISFVYYRTIGFIRPFITFAYKLQMVVHAKCALNQKSQKNVTANNCHPKVATCSLILNFVKIPHI